MITVGVESSFKLRPIYLLSSQELEEKQPNQTTRLIVFIILQKLQF